MLPKPQVPFPVSSDHRVRPDLVRLEGPPFLLDCEYPRYRAAKLEAFASEPSSALLSPAHQPSKVSAALEGLWSQLPQAPGEDAGSIPPTSDLLEFGKAAALRVQEDLVLMHGTQLEALWVCFPSHWNPLDKIGRSFAEIHTPVPHSERLQAAQHNVARAMSQKGPFVRYVWGLTFDPALSAHPHRPTRLSGPQVYFRTERQVTLPLPELERSWFLIRVYVVPVERVAHTPERRAALRHALQTLPEAHRTYKPATVAAHAWLEAQGFFR
ncbi:MAG: DUF3445 domain-containing protein [Thermaceae bacterium]|nr:DUF3445 domain-containing protein [Thermaceae bacterium]